MAINNNIVVTNLTIKATITKANIDTIQELMNLVNTLVMPLAVLTNQMWGGV